MYTVKCFTKTGWQIVAKYNKTTHGYLKAASVRDTYRLAGFLAKISTVRREIKTYNL